MFKKITFTFPIRTACQNVYFAITLTVIHDSRNLTYTSDFSYCKLNLTCRIKWKKVYMKNLRLESFAEYTLFCISQISQLRIRMSMHFATLIRRISSVGQRTTFILGKNMLYLKLVKILVSYSC